MSFKENMNVLVVGASGATGQLLVQQLLNRGLNIKIIVRLPDKLPKNIRHHHNLSVIHASVLNINNAEMAQHINNCDAIASCLGHNMSFKGIYGHPRQLVADATHRLCHAIKTNKPNKPVKFVLMNTTGNSNRDIPEQVSLGHKCVIGLIRLLLPPHLDNERAADYLRTKIGQNDKEIEWAVVRPDSLIDKTDVSKYSVFPSPVRDAIFDAGTTSRINVGHFMAELIVDNNKWNKWKGQMPVIYNKQT